MLRAVTNIFSFKCAFMHLPLISYSKKSTYLLGACKCHFILTALKSLWLEGMVSTKPDKAWIRSEKMVSYQFLSTSAFNAKFMFVDFTNCISLMLVNLSEFFLLKFIYMVSNQLHFRTGLTFSWFLFYLFSVFFKQLRTCDASKILPLT